MAFKLRNDLSLTKKSILKKVAKRKKRKEVEEYQRTKAAKRKTQLYAAESSMYEQKTRRKKAKEEASPFRGLFGVKKRKQGKTSLGRKRVQLF